MNPGQLAVVISICLFFGMAICLEVGYRMGSYVAEKTEAAHEGTSTIQAAVFALLGLLLGFTFANGISHLDQRRQLIVQESNAIGTAYLRLDLLPASQQQEMRQLFRQYLGNFSRKSGRVLSRAAATILRRTWRGCFCRH